MKKATWYGHENMSVFRVYCWYCRELSGKTREEILKYQVEPGTIGEIAQAIALGISLSELLNLKARLAQIKASEWEANMPMMAETVISACMP